MKKISLRLVASIAILTLTTFMFIWYLHGHPEYVTQLLHTQPGWLVLIVVSSLFAVYALNLLYDVLVRMTGKQLKPTENILLTIYSSIANFFGPLQSGPGVRAAYLKTKHKVSLRAYFLVTLLYYATFATINAFCLLVGTRPWWQALLASVGAAAVSYGVIRFATSRRKKETKLLHITPKLITAMVVLTALQVSFIGLRYYFALQAAHAHVSIGQAISYTGAANFAVFVSITPDGVGIREAFLLFAQNIHHVSTHAIVAANVIDRATFVLFLGVLFIIALSLHARDGLQPGIKKFFSSAKDTE
jgi:uncharacterized membrane protein YbhN (UPF0104 family)